MWVIFLVESFEYGGEFVGIGIYGYYVVFELGVGFFEFDDDLFFVVGSGYG